MKLSLLVGGTIVLGVPSHPGRWGEDLNALIDELAARETDIDPLRFDWLRAVPAESEEDPTYITLRDVDIFGNQIRLRLDFIRLDTERVDAWWVRAPVSEGSEKLPSSLPWAS